MGRSANIPATAINLLRGWPHPSLLPVDLVRDATQIALSDPSVAHDGLLYGPDPGYEPCRKAVAEWLASFYQPSASIAAGRICITGGASQNLGRMLNVFTDPTYTRNVWIVAPAYMLAFRLFEDAGLGARMRAVPEDEAGLDITFLRREIEKSEAQAQREGKHTPLLKRGRKVYKHVIYCVPTFSNPSSKTMSLERRTDLVRLAREYDALVTPDDVYDFLQWPTEPPTLTERGSQSGPESMQAAHLPRLVDVDRELDGGPDRPGADGFGNACSNGTFSKIAGPGLRAGWVEGTEKFAHGVSQAGTSRSGGAPSQLTSTYLTHLITTGQIQHHIRSVLQPAYALRYRTLMDAIESHLVPLGFALPQPDRKVVGGYFVWVTLPGSMRARDLTDICQRKQNLIIAAGSVFEVPGDETVQARNSVRLCFAWEDSAKLSEGVERMSAAAKQLLHQNTDTGDEVDSASEAGSLAANLQSFK